MRILFAVLLFTACLSALPEASAAQAGGCGAGLAPQADAESFTAAGRDVDSARLARETGANFVAAATRLCGSGALRAADLAAFTHLLVRNAEGSAEPVVYDDAEQGAENLILEFAFAEGGPPSEAAIGTAIRCWHRPETAGCDQGGD